MLSALRLLFAPKRKFNGELVKLLGFYPNNWEIYELAFTHRSASVFLADGSTVNNERLEFLGDAVLDAIVAEYLFIHYPINDEGFLSQLRSKIVKRKHMNHLAVKLGIDKFIVSVALGNNSGKHIHGNALEALIGAIYLDKGYNRTKRYIIKNVFEKHIDLESIERVETDFKSRIIEWAQKNKQEISFDCQEEYHGEGRVAMFVSHVLVDNVLKGEGKAHSKKEAEQNAAEQAFYLLSEHS